jgi:hypothetical protein
MLVDSQYNPREFTDLLKKLVSDPREIPDGTFNKIQASYRSLASTEELAKSTIKGIQKKLDQYLKELPGQTLPLVITNVIKENRLYEGSLFGTRSSQIYTIIFPEHLEDTYGYLKRNNLYIFDNFSLGYAQKQQKIFLFINDITKIKAISYVSRFLDKEKIIDETNTQFIRKYNLGEKIKGVFITNNEIQKLGDIN